MSARLHVIIYDVVSDARRDKVFQLLKEYGVPVQRSAFEARLTELEHRSLLARVEKLLDSRIDRFACYTIGKAEEPRIKSLGVPRPEIEEGEVVIV